MFRISQVGVALEMPEASLRNWLARGHIDLFEAQPERGWRVFTMNDVLVLSVVVELIKYDYPIRKAFDDTRKCLGFMNFRTLEGMPNYIYATRAPDGGWIAETDEALLGMRFPNRMAPSAIRVAVPITMANARRRAEALTPAIDDPADRSQEQAELPA